MYRVPYASLVFFAWFVAPHVACGQGELVGRVVTDSARVGVAGAAVVVPGLGRTVRADSGGRFRMLDLPEGEHVVLLRSSGFQEARFVITIEDNQVLVRDFPLAQGVQLLPGETVIATARPSGRLAGFWDRKQMGIGHFLTREELAKAEGGMRRTGDVLSLVPGIAVKRGSNQAWVATGGRATNPGGGCAFCRGGKLGPRAKRPNDADESAGARDACYMDVYLDGVLVFDSTHPEHGLFNVNALEPSHLEAVEVYTSAGQMPAQFNRTANGCGVLLLWTR